MVPAPVTLQFSAVCTEPVAVPVKLAVPPTRRVGLAELRPAAATEMDGVAIGALNDADPLPGFWTWSVRLPLALAATGTCTESWVKLT